MAAEHGPLEKEIPVRKHHFQGPCLFFGVQPHMNYCRILYRTYCLEMLPKSSMIIPTKKATLCFPEESQEGAVTYSTYCRYHRCTLCINTYIIYQKNPTFSELNMFSCKILSTILRLTLVLDVLRHQQWTPQQLSSQVISNILSSPMSILPFAKCLHRPFRYAKHVACGPHVKMSKLR